ncbi:MAG: hypothetical protein J1E78_02115 [Muribaculaceae bacterium]|nr:hypothetical protein [Muribaculaceae bacterium]
MKKILFTGLLIAVLGTVSLAVSKPFQQTKESNIILANIEALADDPESARYAEVTRRTVTTVYSDGTISVEIEILCTGNGSLPCI